MELKLPIKLSKKVIKQMPRQFAPKIISKIKEEIERLLRSKFIRKTRHVEWLANIVNIIKKNTTLRVCMDFIYLNVDPKRRIPDAYDRNVGRFSSDFQLS